MNNNTEFTELRPEVFMDSKDLHGEIRSKYCIVNKNNTDLCALTSNEAGTKMLPAVFNTLDDAEFYLSFIDEEDRANTKVVFYKISYFDHGAVLLTKKESQNDIKKLYPFAVGDRHNYADYECNGAVRYYRILINRKKELTRKYKYYYRIKIKKNKFPDVAKKDVRARLV